MQGTLELLRDIGEVFPNPWVAVDRDGRILAYNRRFFGLFPRAVALRLEGEQLDAILRFESPGDSRPVDVVNETMAAGEVVHHGSLNVVLPNDENRLISVSGAALKKRKGPDQTMEGAMILLGVDRQLPTDFDLADVDPSDAAGRKLLELGETIRRLRAENARLRRKLYL